MTGELRLPPVSRHLPWQNAAMARLAAQFAAGQLPHALLLTGPEHSGASELALTLARLLLCTAPADGHNCGRCHACELTAAGSHGDLRRLAPGEDSRVIRIDQVRSLTEFLNRTAGLGQRKVAVLAPAEAMNANAANALLKALEEPAPETYLILVCHRLHGLPATIRSRCQMLRLPAPDRAVALEWLVPLVGDAERGAYLLELAGGRPLLARGLLEGEAATQLAGLRDALWGLIEGRLDVTPVAALLAGESGERQLEHLAAQLQRLVRDLARRGSLGERGRAAFELLDEIQRLRRALDGGANPNRQLMVEAILTKCHSRLGAAVAQC